MFLNSFKDSNNLTIDLLGNRTLFGNVNEMLSTNWNHYFLHSTVQICQTFAQKFQNDSKDRDFRGITKSYNQNWCISYTYYTQDQSLLKQWKRFRTKRLSVIGPKLCSSEDYIFLRHSRALVLELIPLVDVLVKEVHNIQVDSERLGGL